MLGSTGSIGRQALEVLEALPDQFEVVALAGRRDAATLAVQAVRLRPRAVAVGDGQSIELPAGLQIERAPTRSWPSDTG